VLISLRSCVLSEQLASLEPTSHKTHVVAKNWSISDFNFSTLIWSRAFCATIPLLLVPPRPLMPPPTALTAEARTSGIISSRSLSPAAMSFLLPPSSKFEGSSAETMASPLGMAAYEDDNKVRDFALASVEGFIGFASRTSSSCRYRIRRSELGGRVSFAFTRSTSECQRQVGV
jgi:hypothetical protein